VMGWGRRMANFLKHESGKWNIPKVIITTIITAVIGTLISFTVTTAYSRYSWMRDQCYKVATHEKAITQTGENLKLQIQVLHGRITTEVDKREHADERLTDLIFKVLEQQQKQVEIQQKGLEKQEQYIMEQRAK